MEPSSEEWLKCVGKNIRSRREEKGLSREELSELVYLAPKSVQRHENGENLTLGIIPVYAAALECSPVDLMFMNFDIKDPVFRALMKIKRCPEEIQSRFLAIIENSIGLMDLNK